MKRLALVPLIGVKPVFAMIFPCGLVELGGASAGVIAAVLSPFSGGASIFGYIAVGTAYGAAWFNYFNCG